MITNQRTVAIRLAMLAALAILTAHNVDAQAPAYSTIYSFKGPPTDGGDPHASLIIGPQGELFGTTTGGGASNYGTVFELSNPAGTWVETVLYSFGAEPDGQYPQANVIFGPGGALYGTTDGGGNGGGTVFELAPPTAEGGAWTESVLHEFNSGVGVQVDAPLGPVLVGKDGTLYATAFGEYIAVSGGVVALAPPAAPGGA